MRRLFVPKLFRDPRDGAQAFVTRRGKHLDPIVEMRDVPAGLGCDAMLLLDGEQRRIAIGRDEGASLAMRVAFGRELRVQPLDERSAIVGRSALDVGVPFEFRDDVRAFAIFGLAHFELRTEVFEFAHRAGRGPRKFGREAFRRRVSH